MCKFWESVIKLGYSYVEHNGKFVQLPKKAAHLSKGGDPINVMTSLIECIKIAEPYNAIYSGLFAKHS